MSIHLPAVTLCAASVLLFANSTAFAICDPFNVHEVYVGDTASDSACTYNSIQQALDATYTCPTVVRITREHLYSGQHLHVSNRNLTLQGEADGVTCYQMAHCVPFGGCHADTTQPLVDIDGSNTSGSVLGITGTSNITLRDLTIKNGAAGPDQYGGGISFIGAGSLTLDTSTVLLNSAGYGGGVSVIGSGGSATLRLKANTLIISNTASHNGGGIQVSGTARLLALESPTLIGFNHAPNGDGGGLQVIGPARADLGAHSNNGSAVVLDNDAAYGGGIAVNAGQGDQLDAAVRLFTTDARYAVAVSGNVAANTGGGIYLKPHVGIGDESIAYLCASDFRIEDNGAQEGTAVYADENYELAGGYYLGSRVYLNSDDPVYRFCSLPETPASLGAVPCAPAVACNSVSANVAQDSGGNPTTGSTLLVQTASLLQADRVQLRANVGGHVARGVDGGMNFSNCLAAGNQVSAQLLYESGGGNDPHVAVTNCTFAHDAIAGSRVIYTDAQSTLSLADTIIDEPGVATLDYNGGAANLAVNYVLSNDVSTLPPVAGVALGEPLFVDAANGDYHLQATSLGLDFAPPVAGDDRDLDGLPHDQDLPSVPNLYGDRDLGAYERQLRSCVTADTIFCEGFENP